MKLIVQIPCYNEQETLARTIADVPRAIPGVDAVEVLIVDDGSTDETLKVALQAGADHIVQHRRNKGLAEAFRSGVDASLRNGADIIVNTDGDNQYPGRCIPALIRPILEGRADIVIGDRQIRTNPNFSRVKRRLQALGSLVVRRLSRTSVPDTVSGFRAISSEAARHLNIVSPFSYTIEMLIQAGKHRMALASVPIETNPVARRSRLFRNVPQFMLHSLTTMVRIYTMYHPLRMFSYLGAALLIAGLVPVARFLYFYMSGGGAGHVQSLVLGGVLALMGFVTLLFALLADLVSFNRRLVETALEKVRGLELEREREREVQASPPPPAPRRATASRPVGPVRRRKGARG